MTLTNGKEMAKKVKNISLKIDGKEFTLIHSEEIDIKHMVRITCTYEDGTAISFWLHVKNVIDNIRMKGVSFRDNDGNPQSL